MGDFRDVPCAGYGQPGDSVYRNRFQIGPQTFERGDIGGGLRSARRGCRGRYCRTEKRVEARRALVQRVLEQRVAEQRVLEQRVRQALGQRVQSLPRWRVRLLGRRCRGGCCSGLPADNGQSRADRDSLVLAHQYLGDSSG